MLVIRAQKCKENGLQNEWLESNLNGSYIYNNLLCQNTKPLHSLLTVPWQNKMMTLVSSLIEEINIDENRYFTNSFKQKSKTKKENNYNLERFYINEHPNFIYNFRGIKLLKSILLVNDKNTTIIKYKLLKPDKSIKLSISPLISTKEHNSTAGWSDKFKYNIIQEPDYIRFTRSDDINIFFYFLKCSFAFKNNDKKNNQNKITGNNDECWFSISSERLKEPDISIIFNNEVERRKSLLDKLKIKNELFKNIIISSGFYIKKKDKTTLLKNSLVNPSTSFQDMINSLNILFTLKEFDTIKDILKFLGSNIKQGLVPEHFDHDNKKFIYSSIDNSFWYLLYLLKFIEFTGDWKFIKDNLWEKVRLIVHNFYNNHIPGIKVDFDGLLLLKTDIGDEFNKGKIIEYAAGKHIALNILWYNAVRITELLSAKFADIEYHTRAEELGFIIKKNFYFKFRDKEKDYFHYRVEIPPTGWKDDSFRPYPIFLISLPFDDLVHYRTKQKIIDSIEDKLLTPFGLMSLAADSNNYIENFNSEKPQSAYNGTIHSYLLFHYITAVLKLNKYSSSARKEVKNLLVNFEKKIKTDIVGFFPRYANSKEPHESAGILDSPITMSEYLRVRAGELGSI